MTKIKINVLISEPFDMFFGAPKTHVKTYLHEGGPISTRADDNFIMSGGKTSNFVL